MPRKFMLDTFRSIEYSSDRNPDVTFDLYIDSHPQHHKARAVYYKQGSRNEVRITRLGGADSPLSDVESTGALSVFSFTRSHGGSVITCHVWVCTSQLDEDVVQNAIGWVEHGMFRVARFDELAIVSDGGLDYKLSHENIPKKWFDEFPSADDVIQKVIELCPFDTLDLDRLLIHRRNCEYELFRVLEEDSTLPIVQTGFETLEEFIKFAHKTLQRRRARSGRSLELHIRHMLREAGLEEGKDFTYQAETENGKRSDFLFPSKAHYDNISFPSDNLRMLAVMTTCRERWRTIISAAKRISVKHLLTLQEGVSVKQYTEMKSSGVQLVVPAGLIASYPPCLRAELTTIESFIGDVRILKSKIDCSS